MSGSKKILKTNEAAAFLGVSRSSLTNWAKQGLIEGGATPGGHYRFKLEELRRFAENRGIDVPGEPESVSTCKILIIDDDEGFREFARDALEEFSGYELRETVDGMQGALLSGSWEPDLILLDIRMPNMNGIEFLKLLRHNRKTSNVKVIVASAYLSPEIREKAEKLHVDIILEKPVRLAKLVASIQSLIPLRLS
jgi:excisionase family DNA binding protein